jgi:hypothetical protein
LASHAPAHARSFAVAETRDNADSESDGADAAALVHSDSDCADGADDSDSSSVASPGGSRSESDTSNDGTGAALPDSASHSNDGPGAALPESASHELPTATARTPTATTPTATTTEINSNCCTTVACAHLPQPQPHLTHVRATMSHESVESSSDKEEEAEEEDFRDDLRRQPRSRQAVLRTVATLGDLDGFAFVEDDHLTQFYVGIDPKMIYVKVERKDREEVSGTYKLVWDKCNCCWCVRYLYLHSSRASLFAG